MLCLHYLLAKQCFAHTHKLPYSTTSTPGLEEPAHTLAIRKLLHNSGVHPFRDGWQFAALDSLEHLRLAKFSVVTEELQNDLSILLYYRVLVYATVIRPVHLIRNMIQCAKQQRLQWLSPQLHKPTAWLRLRLNDLLQERQVTYASLSEYDIQHLNKQPVLARQLRSVLGFR